MLYGQEIIILTDHKNLTFQKFSSDQVCQWRLFVEDFGPKIFYIKGQKNLAADALSRLPAHFVEKATIDITSEIFNIVLEDEDILCPIEYKFLYKEQLQEMP